MTLLVVGVSHRSAPVSVLERAAIAPGARAGLLHELLAAEPVLEAAVLSTCNRIELYADVDRYHAGIAELSGMLARYGGVGPDELDPYLYARYGDEAVTHLFTVACGLDSMVVGEGQILGQLKDALALAQDEQSAGRQLNELFQRALRVGKRAHSETGIDRAGQSLVTFGLGQLGPGRRVLVDQPSSSDAVSCKAERRPHTGSYSDDATTQQMAVAGVEGPPRSAGQALAPAAGPGSPAVVPAQASGDAGQPDMSWVRGLRALVIGAGSMSSLAAATLARAGVAELVIANRTLERAERLAASLDAQTAAPAPEHTGEPGAGADCGDPGCPVGSGCAERAAARGPRARAVPINAISITAELALADLVISCTGATGLVLTAQAVAGALRERRADQREPALLDLAMPRDIDAAVHRLPGVRFVDIESLAAASADAPMAADVQAVRDIVAEEVADFGAAQRAAYITPTVVALRAMAADVVSSELARLHGRLPGLGEKERAEVTHAVRRVVDKLLHAPTVRVKELAGEPGGADYAAALRELFDLDPQPAAASSGTGSTRRNAEQERS
ncbi:glutamyl-tRNA reductase [Streptomyces harbinensis]|uniref:glutamyl-tRNA reductase n=1 Tax=Streptomyces harbinensis TaxID=1176198 RepID=UPI0015914F6A|nr:glutamyl-tRNA reductase [Streptomyces harbinensis]QKV70040.1 glutamyl-tRNA reductase [Streptomyces harbinensis]